MHSGDNSSILKNKKAERLYLTSDLVFKAVFGRETAECKAALIAFLNDVLQPEDPVRDIVYINPFQIREHDGDKGCCMDIEILTQNGERVDIEMQAEVSPIYIGRSVYYGAGLTREGLKEGQGYGEMKRSIVISILRDNLFAGPDYFHSVFVYKEKTRNTMLTDLCELHFIELRKTDLEKPADQMTPAERWAVFFRCAGREESRELISRLCRESEGIRMADTIMMEVTAEERMRAKEWARKIGEIDRISGDQYRLAKAQEEGLARGMAKGMAKGISEGMAKGLRQGTRRGRQQARRDMVRAMKREGIPIEQIARVTGFTAEEISLL